MTLARPPLTQLLEAGHAFVDARIPGADSRLRRSNLDVLVTVNVGAAHGLYGFIDAVARQILPDTAETEFLDRHAANWGIARKPAALAVGTAVATGANASVIPAGTVLSRADAVEFETTAEAVIAAGEAVLTLQARVGGAAGDTAAAVSLEFVSPLPGVDSLAAAEPIEGGSDGEIDSDMLARLLARIQNPPHGGNTEDYAQWVLAIPGVTRVFVSPLELGLGTVTVRFVMDARSDIFPLAADIAVVQDALDILRPVTAEVFVVSPIAAALDLSIQIAPDTPETRVAIEAGLADLILREAVPGGTILLSHLREAISLAAGETDHVLISPVANVVHASGAMARLGDITWGAL